MVRRFTLQFAATVLLICSWIVSIEGSKWWQMVILFYYWLFIIKIAVNSYTICIRKTWFFFKRTGNIWVISFLYGLLINFNSTTKEVVLFDFFILFFFFFWQTVIWLTWQFTSKCGNLQRNFVAIVELIFYTYIGNTFAKEDH